MVGSWTGITGVLRSTQMATIRIALWRSWRVEQPSRVVTLENKREYVAKKSVAFMPRDFNRVVPHIKP
jgi:hypothetical protein